MEVDDECTSLLLPDPIGEGGYEAIPAEPQLSSPRSDRKRQRRLPVVRRATAARGLIALRRRMASADRRVAGDSIRYGAHGKCRSRASRQRQSQSEYGSCRSGSWTDEAWCPDALVCHPTVAMSYTSSGGILRSCSAISSLSCWARSASAGVGPSLQATSRNSSGTSASRKVNSTTVPR